MPVSFLPSCQRTSRRLSLMLAGGKKNKRVASGIGEEKNWHLTIQRGHSMYSDMQESVQEENLKNPKVASATATGAIKAPNKDDKIKAFGSMSCLPKYSNGRRPCHWETSPISEELHEADATLTTMDTENASLRHAAAKSAVVTGQLFKGGEMQKGRKPKQIW